MEKEKKLLCKLKCIRVLEDRCPSGAVEKPVESVENFVFATVISKIRPLRAQRGAVEYPVA